VHAGTASHVDATLKTQVKYTMDSRDLNAIRLLSGLLGASNKCFILVEAGHMEDFVSKASVASGSSAIAVETNGYLADTTKPTLQDFTLDMNTGKLHLTFNDVVLKSALKPSEITLSSKSNDDSINFKLTGGTGTTDPAAGAFEIVVALTDDDLNGIKLTDGLGTTKTNTDCDTFIYFGPLMITDASGTQVDAIARLSAKEATGVTADTTDPKVLNFDFNMDTQKIIITFDESIVKTSFKLAEMKVQNTIDGSDAAPITFEEAASSDVTWNDLQTEVTAKMTKASFDAIAAVKTLATEKSNTYLVVSVNAAADTAAKKVTEITTGAAPNVANHFEDNTAPTVTAFTLDMNANKATVTFSETVDIANINFRKLVVQPTNAATPTFRLTAGVLDSATPSTVASFTLDDDDVDALKLQDGLASADVDSAMSADEGLVLDMNSKSSTAVAASDPVDATQPMTKDTTDIELVKFTFDLNAGKMTLTFSEPALASSLKVGEITLQNEVGATASEKKVLSSGVSGSAVDQGIANGYEIRIKFSGDDLNAIKTFENLGTTKAKTIIVITEDAITDIAGNKVVAIDAANGKASLNNDPDNTPPALNGVAVNMHDGTVTLNFNEPIRADSLVPEKITVHSNKASVPTTSYELTGGDTVSANGLQIVVKLIKTDLDKLKKETGLLTGTGDSFVSLEAGAVADMAGTGIAILAPADAKQATSHTPDGHAPTIDSFTLNLNTRRLVIGFSETMTLSSFTFTKITLQTSSDAKSAHQHTLSAGTKVSTEDGTSFEVEFTQADANQLTVRLIGSEEAKTWMTAEAGAVQDTLPQNNVALVNGANALQVTSGGLVEDTDEPSLSSFDLNMNTGELMLVFDEAIDDSKVVPSGLRLVASTANGAVDYTLTTSHVCTKCANNAWVKTACSQDADTVCESCKTCSGTEYYTTACTDTADAACATCSDCGVSEYIAGPCTGFSNTECAACTSSCPANSFKTADCSASADLQCSTCKVCADDEYVKTACSSTADTVCEKHSTSCATDKYMTATGTKDSDITCATCDTCEANEFEIVACGVRNRVCKGCSQAESGFEYTTSACSTSSDAVIDACDVCGGEEFASTICAGSNNAVCTTCTSDCGTGKFASAKCTATADTTCSDCPNNCDTCGIDGKCAVCSSGYALTLSYTCEQSCPDQSFKASDGHCDYCEYSGKTCSGPDLADTLSCVGPYVFQTVASQCYHACDDNVAEFYDGSSCSSCHSECDSCFGPDSDNCRTCPSGKLQFGYECADACPDGWYETNGRCRKCSADCKTCSDGTTCTECTNGKILEGSFCHDVCADPTKFGA